MKTLPKILLALTAVAALSFAYPASVQAVPITYTYTGNPYTTVTGPYTTSMFVTAMITLASPLPANTSTTVTPLSFSLFDGVQTITELNATNTTFAFFTGPTGSIVDWIFTADGPSGQIQSVSGSRDVGRSGGKVGLAFSRGTWSTDGAVPDVGSSLALLSLSLTALGVAARKFKRAAA